MKARIGLLALAATAASFALVACSGTSGAGPSPTPTAPPTVGSWGTEEHGKPSMTIEPDGAYAGSDGCNSLAGHGAFEGDAFEFGDMVSTRMACVGVDTWLSAASTAKAEGAKLVVYDATGAEIGTLDKR